VIGWRAVVVAILRAIRWLAWAALAGVAGFSINYLERKAKVGDLNLPTVVFSLTELFAAFCIALAIDRALALSADGVTESKPGAT